VVLRAEPEALPRPQLRYGLLTEVMSARLQEKQLLRCREESGTLFPELDPELRLATP